jgi:hypothetical protein
VSSTPIVKRRYEGDPEYQRQAVLALLRRKVTRTAVDHQLESDKEASYAIGSCAKDHERMGAVRS